MKKTLITSVILASATIFSSVAFAADSQWEIWSGSLANVVFNGSGATATTTTNSSTTNINLFTPYQGGVGFGPALGYILGSNIEIKVTPGYYSTGNTAVGGSAQTGYQFLAGVNYSFMSNMEDSVWAEVQAGVVSMTPAAASGVTATSNSNFTWMVAAGKRFSIMSHVTWNPEISYSSMSQAATVAPGAATQLTITPAQFTLFL